MALVEPVASVLLGFVFLVSGLSKLGRYEAFQKYVADGIDSRSIAHALAKLVVVLELGFGVAFFTSARPVVAIAALLFVLLTSRWLLGGQRTRELVSLSSCRCFGGSPNRSIGDKRPVLRPTWWAIRNGSIAGLSMVASGFVTFPVYAFFGGFLMVLSLMLLWLGLAVITLRREGRVRWARGFVPPLSVGQRLG